MVTYNLEWLYFYSLRTEIKTLLVTNLVCQLAITTCLDEANYALILTISF